MKQNVILINVDVNVKNWLMWKRLCLESNKCIFKNGKCLASMMNDSAITCDEIMNSYNEKVKTIPTNFNEIFYLPFYELL